jgi:hypothetical protein
MTQYQSPFSSYKLWWTSIQLLARRSPSNLETLAIVLTMVLWPDDVFMLTVDQAEAAILLLRPRVTKLDGWLNLMVALCMTPWNVDVSIGGHGVCYFGNLGETPTSIMEEFETSYCNMSALNQRHHLFKTMNVGSGGGR